MKLDRWISKALNPVCAPKPKSDIELIDEILESGNESWTGEDIRQRLAEAGYIIIKARQRLNDGRS